MAYNFGLQQLPLLGTDYHNNQQSSNDSSKFDVDDDTKKYISNPQMLTYEWTNNYNQPNTENTAWIQQPDMNKPTDLPTIPSPLESGAIWPAVMPPLNFPPLGIPSIPNLMPAANMIMNHPVGTLNSEEIIRCKNCTLYSPNPNTPAKPMREKPPGCKTIFVGGLPENCSGYTLKFNSDMGNSHRIYIDYANARDDMYEYECKQRQLKREQRHRERGQCRTNKVFTAVHYSEKEANNIIEKLKGEETFMDGIPVAVHWLERGECSKRNANTFYVMIQSCTSHVRRLLQDKKQCEDDFKEVKEKISSRFRLVLNQVSEIEKLYVSSSHKKVWDHFTKAQRKNIDSWRKLSAELKDWHLDTDIASDNEMDVSDSEDSVSHKKSRSASFDLNSLQAENDDLKCQLEASKNEVYVIRSELQFEISKKDEHIEKLQNKYITAKEKHEEAEKHISSLETKIEKISESKIKHKDSKNTNDSNQRNSVAVIDLVDTVSGKEAQIIGLISIFLHIHPFGVSLDYICSYLHKFTPYLRTSDVEDLLNKFKLMFRQEITGIGVNMEKRWRFIGFDSTLS